MLVLLSAALAGPTVLPVSEVVWEDLNPARGDKSPKAGTVFGDRKADVATGFLLRPVDGFESPPHIHNVSYRGVVLQGLIHNDDPEAEHEWMGPGAFWTQPSGDVHITAARGTDVLAYIEIDAGPYLVRPTDQAFDDGQVAVNLDAKNVVWLDGGTAKGVKANGAEVAYLWGTPNGDHGAFVALEAGSSVVLAPGAGTTRVVVIDGNPSLAGAGPLASGSVVTTEEAVDIACAEACRLYVRAETGWRLK